MKKIKEYDIIRAIAVLLVLISHCMYYKMMTNYGGISYDISETIQTNNFDMKVIQSLRLMRNVLYTFHMPLFFALSGALFKNSIKREKFKSINDVMIQKAKRLIIPFIIVTIFFSTPIKYLSGYYNTSSNLLKDIFIGQVLMQGNTHLWFLPTLFFEFIIVWKINKKNFNHNIMIGTMILLNLISSRFKIIILQNTLCYLLYFYIGFLFEESREKVNNKIECKKNSNIVITIVFIVSTIIIFNLFHFNENIYLKVCKIILKVIFAILGTWMIYLISFKISKNMKDNDNKFVNTVNNYSLGIYLYSDPFNYLILYLIAKFCGIMPLYKNPWIIIIFISRIIITLGISMLITAILKKKKFKYIC